MGCLNYLWQTGEDSFSNRFFAEGFSLWLENLGISYRMIALGVLTLGIFEAFTRTTVSCHDDGPYYFGFDCASPMARPLGCLARWFTSFKKFGAPIPAEINAGGTCSQLHSTRPRSCQVIDSDASSSISGCLCYCDRSRIRWHPSCEWGGCCLVCVHEHAEAQQFFPWISDSMQKHINAWELLGQFSLAYCLHHSIKGRRSPIAVTFACDNTSAEAAHLKVLSTFASMCQLLAVFSVSSTFITFWSCHSTYSIPGMWNDKADALSRGRSLLCCPPELHVAIPWKWLCSSIPEHAPSQAKIPHTLLSRWVQNSGGFTCLNIEMHLGVLILSVDVSILFGCPKPQF